MPGPNDSLIVSPSGLIMMETFEALRLVGYPDIKGVPTIGYGHTGPEISIGLVWTQLQAVQAFQDDVMWATAAVHKDVTVVLNQNQFDALVSFTYNVGVNAFGGSTLLHLVNEGDFPGAAAQFGKWIYAGHIISSGLINRRKKETALFELAVVA
jgi:lysozyme